MTHISINSDAYSYPSENILLKRVELEYCLSKYHDILYGKKALDRVRTVCVGLLTFGVSGLLTVASTAFIDKFGVPKELIEKVLTYGYLLFSLTGALGIICTAGRSASQFYKCKNKTIKSFVDNEYGMLKSQWKVYPTSDENGTLL